jgi:hypothetical protein
MIDRLNEMPCESDFLLVARSMIQRYDSDAAMEAAERADVLLARGDIEGSAAWVKIMTAIERLQAVKPALGEKVQ